MLLRKTKMSILALALAVPLLGAAQQPPGPPPGPGGPGRGDEFGPQWRRGGGPRGPRAGRRHRRGNGRHMRGGGFGRLLRDPAMRERLGFTPEQAAKLQGQESAFARARLRNQTHVRVKRMELEELLAAEKPDRAGIDKKLREVQDAEAAASRAAIEHRLAAR